MTEYRQVSLSLIYAPGAIELLGRTWIERDTFATLLTSVTAPVVYASFEWVPMIGMNVECIGVRVITSVG